MFGTTIDAERVGKAVMEIGKTIPAADDFREPEQKTDHADNRYPFPGAGVIRSFSGVTWPYSNSYSGTGTTVAFVNISNSGATMTADITVGTPQGISVYSDLLPGKLKLPGNFPNPFSPNTVIKFEIPEYSRVKLEVFSGTVQNIKLLADGDLELGSYSVTWNGKVFDAKEAGSGVYFNRLTDEAVPFPE